MNDVLAQVVLPDVGFSIVGFIATMVSGLGGVMGVVFGGILAFHITFTGLEWISGIERDRKLRTVQEQRDLMIRRDAMNRHLQKKQRKIDGHYLRKVRRHQRRKR